MTVREMPHDEILRVVMAGRDELAQEAFRLRRQAESAADRARAIRWETLAAELDDAIANLRMNRVPA